MKSWAKALSAVLILTAVSSVHAQQQGGPPGGQDNGGPPGGGPGGPGGGQNGGPGGGPDGGPPDPAEMRQMMDRRIKSALGTTDEAWDKLQPLIDKVSELEHQLDSGPRLHGPPHPEDDGNGPDGQDDDRPKSEIESAISNLKKVLSDKSAGDDKIAAAMKVVEDAEKKTRDDLTAAQKELKAATNLRQQAVLTALGVLS